MLTENPAWFPGLLEVLAEAETHWKQRNDVIHGIWLHGQEGDERTCLRPVRMRTQSWSDIPKVTWTVQKLLELAEALRVDKTPIVAAAESGRPTS